MTKVTSSVLEGLFNADRSGVIGASSLLASAVAARPHVTVPPGTYLIDDDATVPAGVTVEFQQGAIFQIAPGVTLTWNGGIIAGPYQQIFSGDLVQSGFTSNVPVPYALGVQGSPQCVPTPFWFGAKGDYDPDTDTGTDDFEAIISALYFGLVTYSPAARYKTSGNLLDKRSFSHHYGDWAATRYYQRGTGPAGTGHLFVLSGLNGGLGIKNAVIEKMWGDNGGLTNENMAAMGGQSGSEVTDCRIDVLAGNAGRHGATIQFYAKDNQIRITCDDTATEAASSRYAASIEGTAAVSGEDVKRNRIDIVCQKGTVGGAQIYDASENEINLICDQVLGDASVGTGVLARLRGGGYGNKIVARANTINGQIAAVDSGQTDYELDLRAKSLINTAGTSGAPFTLAGPDGDVRIRIDDHQDTDAGGILSGARTEARIQMTTATTAPAVTVSGADAVVTPEIVGLNCANGVVTLNAAGAKCVGGYVQRAAGLKGVRLAAAQCDCLGVTIKGDGAEAIRVEAAATSPNVQGNRLIGASPEITALFAAASTGVIANNPGDVGTTNKFMRLGNFALWPDATGDLRINNGSPATDTSGTVVGTQT